MKKLRHCHPVYILVVCVMIFCSVISTGYDFVGTVNDFGLILSVVDATVQRGATTWGVGHCIENSPYISQSIMAKCLRRSDIFGDNFIATLLPSLTSHGER